jgi:Holliday junction resolvase
VTEKQFENKVKAFLKDNGCWVLKTWSNGVQREGIPDLLVCCNGVFLGVELKAESGHPSELQLWNIRQIRKAGGIAMVLYLDEFDAFKNLIRIILEEKTEVAQEFQFHFKEGKVKK